MNHRQYRRGARSQLMATSSKAPPDAITTFRPPAEGTAGASSEAAIRLQAQLLDAVGQAVIATDLEGRVTYWNRCAEKMYGWLATEVIGRNVLELTLTEGTRVEAEEIMTILRRGGSWSGEFVLRRRDGTTFHALVTDTPVVDEAGELRGIVGVSVDLTDQKRAEEELLRRERALQENERLLALTQQIARVGTWAWDVATNTVTWSDQLFHQYGLEPQPAGMTYERYLELLHPDDRAMADGFVREAFRTRKPFAFDHRIASADGGERWFHGRGDVVLDDAGRVVRMVGSSQEITERKRAEAELRQQAHIVETISDAVIVMDVEMRVTDWNPAATRIFGYTREEMLGRPLRLLNAPELSEEIDRQVREAFARDGRWVGEIPFLRKDGARGVADVIVAVQYDAHARPQSIISVSRDVIDRRRLEAQLQQAQKMEAVGRLAGGIAHDFNNMLTAVKAYTEFLLEDIDQTDPRRTDVQEIAKSADRAASLTRQLLAFSRKQVLQPRPLDLNDVVEGMGKMLRRVIGEDVQVLTRLDPDLRLVEADPSQLEQVIMNLAVNARDAMPDGGTLTIETQNVTLDYVEAAWGIEPGAYAQLTISDTGVGMDATVRAQIFEPFFTTKPVGQGTGLGLSTVYGIVKQSGGHISVYSEPGTGSTFKVYLPYIGSSEPAPTLGRERPRFPGGSETIVLVDDDEGARAVSRRILQRAGYTVLSAPDGVEAMRLVGEAGGRVDLLITDVVMPGLGGRDLVAHVRETLPTLRVLFVSGYTEEGVRKHGVLDADSAFLEKPFTAERLAQTVRELLDSPRGSARAKR
jgi:two-component system cell cycle sensor histidine kinase/response regulator CckA